MRILERKNKTDFEFKVVKSFMLHTGEPSTPGGTITLPEGPDVDGLAQRGKIVPTDIADGQTYVALRDILLPSTVKQHECKRLDLISLTKSDGLRLMLDRSALPADPLRWRPYKMRLKTDRTTTRAGRRGK
jgi:hypothetical protein